MKLAICPPMMMPAINGTTVYAQQLSDYFKAPIISTNALDWISFHSEKGKTHKNGHEISHLKTLTDTETLSKMRRESNGLLNAYVNGPISQELMSELIKSDTDIIHSLTLPFLNNYYNYYACKLTGKKSVITPFYIKGLVSDSHLDLLKKMDLVLACTEYEKNCIGSDNARVIPMSVNPDLFKKANGERFKTKYKIDGPLVLFVGHANYEKGAYTMLEAAKKVKATFAFMGPHTNGFKSRARGLKNVKLINPQLTNKCDAFAACDAYCMPSRAEAFGITYLEAWASKKPVIAADTPVAREVIGEAGILVQFDSDITSAVNESLERKELGIKGHEKLMKCYTEEIAMSKLTKLYKELLEC